MPKKTIVNQIIKRANGAFCMVLLEEGPWGDDNDIIDHLTLLQDRMYDCVDIAIDGKLAQKYPESKGKEVVIRLDCYDVPEDAVNEYYNSFEGHVRSDEGICGDLENNANISGISFEISHRSLSEKGGQGSGDGEKLDSDITFGNEYD